MSDFNLRLKLIKGVKNTLAYTLSRLINLELTEFNQPEREANEYGYAMFEQLLDIQLNSSKHKPVPPIHISNVNATNATVTQKKDDKNIKFH